MMGMRSFCRSFTYEVMSSSASGSLYDLYPIASIANPTFSAAV